MNRLVIGFGIAAVIAGLAFAQSVERVGPVDDYNITAYPLYGAVVVPDDNSDLTNFGMVRADADGAAKVICWGNTTTITVTLVAGEFVPCVVKRLYDTDTAAITFHVFY